MIKVIAGVINDYVYLARHQRFVDSPLLPNNPHSPKPPILLLPGVLESWHIFDPLVVPLIDRGFPIFTPEALGRSTDQIEILAEKVQHFIETHNLNHVILIGHSKGGLVGKYAIVYDDPQRRINQLFAIATPFLGARSSVFLPGKGGQEMAVGSDLIRQLDNAVGANSHIVNLKAAFDNHIWGRQPDLPGGRNIMVPIVGHHHVIQHPLVLQTIMAEIEGVEPTGSINRADAFK